MFLTLPLAHSPRAFTRTVFLLLVVAGIFALGFQNGIAALDLTNTAPIPLVTTVAQFRTIPPGDFLEGCSFRLTGTVTLVDTNRDFLVLQDGTGAVGLDCVRHNLNLRPGDSVILEASNCSPALVKFSAYPNRPSGWDIRESFEAPANWGEYHLTRMRGFLQPPVSGNYTFWTSSDNSSELWLSTDAEPSKIRKIASVARYEWTLAREWTKFPAQRSEDIWLNAGQSYYIEALQEQTGGADNLAVAWQGPNLGRAVIAGQYLTPWNRNLYAGTFPPTNGILFEYWTNFTAGDLSGLGGPRPYQDVLSVENLRVVDRRGTVSLPVPANIRAGQSWSPLNNYRWSKLEGTVRFTSQDGDNLFVQLADGKTIVQVRTLNANLPRPRLAPNIPVRIEGVCEGTYDESTSLTPGLVWVTTANGITIVDAANATSDLSLTNEPAPPTPDQPPAAMGGFYTTRGVVTFSNRVFDKDCVFVQEGNTVMFVSLEGIASHAPLVVGQLLELGGALKTDKSLPIITPLAFAQLGWRALPKPNVDPIQYPLAPDRDGKWTEIQGVVHTVNSNGTLSVIGTDAPMSVWLGQTGSNDLSHYLDAKVRVWGVLSLSTWPTPVLLVPSPSFVEVDESPAPDPFHAPLHTIVELKQDATPPSQSHRVRVIGEVTLVDAEWFFVQDRTSGIRVQSPPGAPVKVGQAVEVVGFPAERGAARVLADAIVRPAAGFPGTEPLKLDLSEGLPSRQSGSLVRAEATLLKARTIGNSQIIELQHGGRVFTATLLTEHGPLSPVAPGSQIVVTGVSDTESTALPLGTTEKEKAAFASLNIWLRSPADLVLVSGPPWWTWKRVALLIGSLFIILSGTLLWVHLLRRRLQRQQALQVAFSRQILERLEDERRRIAANLHDGLSQVLLAIRNQTLMAMQRGPDENSVRNRLEEISDATSQALDEVRQITHGLRPYQLDRLGLTQSIRTILNQVSSDTQIVFANRVEDVDKTFDQDSEIHVYRIVQEAINNILKHSSANEAAVVIKHRNQIVSLSIRDNGQGFDMNLVPASEPNSLGYGLSGIAERVRILGGTLAVESRPGKGTSLTIEIPVPVRDDEIRNHHIDS